MRKLTQDEQLLQQFLPMIRKHAKHVAIQYHLDRDDVEGQGLLIFTKTLRDYNSSRGSFSTFLWHRLRGGLSDYGKQQSFPRFQVNSPLLEMMEEQTVFGLSDSEYYALSDHSLDQFLDAFQRAESKQLLSEDARVLLDFILGREWYNPEVPLRVTLIALQHGWFAVEHDWSGNRVLKAWRELRYWFNHPLEFMENHSAVFA